MNWFLLFLGAFLAVLAGLLPASAGMVCRILAVVVFALGAVLALLPMLPR